MHDLDMTRAFIGLLFYSAVFKSNQKSTRALFATNGSGRDIFRCVMSRHQFEILLTNLQFGNPDNRNERKRIRLDAPHWRNFRQLLYSLGSCTCIDEMLISFRGCCKFKVYIDIKATHVSCRCKDIIFTMSTYVLAKNSDGSPLPPEDQHFSKPTQAVVGLPKEIQGINKNVTGDNRFPSVELVNALRSIGLAYVKPEIITYYNGTKGGIDALDKECANYSTGRWAKRWPMAIFYHLLDISAVNSIVLFNCFK
ncbi:hypothetical protein PR048_030895 [Dryococelus australis]|uniref:PiggyBac transposable element-derived protein domain-containing protein n=1 Tax=Dryococelus australis TaxID=614101 RepID=A0ABQ9GA63_9NEOP|nr:hypothetical protein PR048_030895 [Dryococelus australis]